jgi:hypothetical protein
MTQDIEDTNWPLLGKKHLNARDNAMQPRLVPQPMIAAIAVVSTIQAKQF